MKEEDFIRKRCGNRDPFKVPEGYFEQFTAGLMDRLPEREEPPGLSVPRTRRLWPRMARYGVAAALCGAMLWGTFCLKTSRTHRQTAALPAQTAEVPAGNLEETYINDMLDYAMVSNQEIALYLTESY